MKVFFTHVFTDIFLGYKNFFHWTVSKIIISLFRYLFACIVVIPFIIMIGIIIGMSDLYSLIEYEVILQSISNVFHYQSSIFLNPSLALFGIMVFLSLSFIVALVGLFYNQILLTQLHIQYKNWIKIPYTKNLYFSMNIFTKYIKIIVFVLLYLLIIASISAWIISLIIYGSFSTQSIESIISASWSIKNFSLAIHFVLIMTVLSGIYVLIRSWFSHIILVENPHLSAKECVKQSFRFTQKKKNILKTIVSVCIISILYLPIYIFWNIIENTTKDLVFYKKVTLELNKNKNNTADKILESQQFYAYSQLQLQYAEFSEIEMQGKYNFLKLASWLHFILYFILVYWTTNLVLVWLYTRNK